MKFYLKQIPCKVALIQDNLSVQLKRPHSANETDPVEHKSFYSMSKPVRLLNCQGGETDGQSVISCRSYSLSTNSLESYDMQRANLIPSYSHGLHEQHKSGDLSQYIFMVCIMIR